MDGLDLEIGSGVPHFYYSLKDSEGRDLLFVDSGEISGMGNTLQGSAGRDGEGNPVYTLAHRDVERELFKIRFSRHGYRFTSQVPGCIRYVFRGASIDGKVTDQALFDRLMPLKR